MRTTYSATNKEEVIPRLDRGIQKTLDCLSSVSRPGRPVEPDNDKSIVKHRCLCGRQDGFTLVELMITMVVFVLAMVAAANIFSGLLTQFKQQSSIAESNIEGIGGLELMRHDVEQAGFGLPWNLNNATYKEAADTSVGDSSNAVYDAANFPGVLAKTYNDAAGNAPRAVVVGNNVLLNGSDVLIIKATNVATNSASQKWEYIVNNGNLPNMLRTWDGSPAEQIGSTDRVIILNPSAGSNRQRVLMNSGGFDVKLNSLPAFNKNATVSPFEPMRDSYTAYLAYGVAPDCNSTSCLRMPFNRADFFIKRPDPTESSMPTRCAAGTGVLYKATVNHANGQLTKLPLLDCVLDMQVLVAVDTDGDGSADQWWDNTDAIIAGFSASEWAVRTRARLKEIRVYLIVQEGQRDISYTSPATVTIADANAGTIKIDDLSTLVGTDYKYYRWKLHTIVITPYNLQ